MARTGVPIFCKVAGGCKGIGQRGDRHSVDLGKRRRKG